MSNFEHMNLIPSISQITRAQREQQNGHKSLVVWFTGFSGSGKSTIAQEIESKLFKQNFHVFTLDGDNTRLGINSDLGFSPEDRSENIRRVAEIAKLLLDSGALIITSFISPFIADREKAKSIIGEVDFMEVYIDCPLEVCESRDVKGLYKKARNGQLKDFTGIDSPFEAPTSPDLVLKTAENSVEKCVDYLFHEILKRTRLTD